MADDGRSLNRRPHRQSSIQPAKSSRALRRLVAEKPFGNESAPKSGDAPAAYFPTQVRCRTNHQNRPREMIAELEPALRFTAMPIRAKTKDDRLEIRIREMGTAETTRT